MIIPCIDLQGGKAVQLVRGRKRALSVSDVLGLLERFRSYPILNVIDLDAAMRKGSNGRWIKRICAHARMEVRVGGGVRNVARAERLLAWGAKKVIVGSAAFRDGAIDSSFLGELAKCVKRSKVIIALDADGGQIVVRGWRERLKLRPEEVMPQLAPYCSGFLCTFVDNEGTMKGTDLAWFRGLRRATRLPVTAAGGIRSMREVAALEKIGMDAAVGMAIYTGKLASDKTGIGRDRSPTKRS
jgi:phosphoribosylformimino-5-aminoimidazole carboxamide ribotide isomerase